jgi:hypothetical protein
VRHRAVVGFSRRGGGLVEQPREHGSGGAREMPNTPRRNCAIPSFPLLRNKI